jgi:hypothetical protein
MPTNCFCRWLIAHEYEDEAFQILADLENKSTDDPFVITQHKEIVYTVQYEQAHAVKWRDLLRGRTGDKGGTKTIRRLLLGAGTQAMQQVGFSNSATACHMKGSLIAAVWHQRYLLLSSNRAHQLCRARQQACKAARSL